MSVGLATGGDFGDEHVLSACWLDVQERWSKDLVEVLSWDTFGFGVQR